MGCSTDVGCPTWPCTACAEYGSTQRDKSLAGISGYSKVQPRYGSGLAFWRAKAYAVFRYVSGRKGHMSRTTATFIGDPPLPSSGVWSRRYVQQSACCPTRAAWYGYAKVPRAFIDPGPVEGYGFNQYTRYEGILLLPQQSPALAGRGSRPTHLLWREHSRRAASDSEGEARPPSA